MGSFNLFFLGVFVILIFCKGSPSQYIFFIFITFFTFLIYYKPNSICIVDNSWIDNYWMLWFEHCFFSNLVISIEIENLQFVVFWNMVLILLLGTGSCLQYKKYLMLVHFNCSADHFIRESIGRILLRVFPYQYSICFQVQANYLFILWKKYFFNMLLIRSNIQRGGRVRLKFPSL